MSTSWWYCLVHSTVEEGRGCAATDRLGPYSSRKDADRALVKARERTAAEDARDKADDDWGRPPAGR